MGRARKFVILYGGPFDGKMVEVTTLCREIVLPLVPRVSARWVAPNDLTVPEPLRITRYGPRPWSKALMLDVQVAVNEQIWPYLAQKAEDLSCYWYWLDGDAIHTNWQRSTR